ncbi:MAG: apolipoprotein N-acyltransferase, partial [Elusimicrobia bacterium]
SKYAAGYARAGADVLVGMTDNAWFLSPLAHEQDLLVATMRAVETRRYLVRAVSGGVSAVVAPTGRVLARLDSGVDGALVESVLPMSGNPPGPAVGRALYVVAAVLVALSLAASARGDGVGR